MPKYAKRVDNNHAEIKAALEAAGYAVKDTHEFPGMLDLQVKSKSGILVPIEIKVPGCRPTVLENRYLLTFGGHVVHSISEALAVMYEIDKTYICKPVNSVEIDGEILDVVRHV